MPIIRAATADDLPELVRLLAQLNETPKPLSDQHRKAFDDVTADLADSGCSWWKTAARCWRRRI